MRCRPGASQEALHPGIPHGAVDGGGECLLGITHFRDAAALSVLPLDGTRLLLIGNTLTD